MSEFLLTLAGIAAVGILFVLVPVAVGVYRRFRGTFRISCPETRKRATVRLDVRHAVLSGLFREPRLRMASCSRWPERRDCDQACLAQLS